MQVLNKPFTDLTLMLVDPHQIIEINVHKIILYDNSEYFQKLLIADPSNTILITVPNADILYDIIMGFYHVKTNRGNLQQWHHDLEMIRCKNFLLLPTEAKLTEAIPESGFDLLMEICDQTERSDSSIELLMSVLASTDIELELPADIADLVRSKCIYYEHIYQQGTDICVRNIRRDRIIKRFECIPGILTNAYYSADYTQLVICIKAGTTKILLYDTSSCELINQLEYTGRLVDICFYLNTIAILMDHDGGQVIHLWDTSTTDLPIHYLALNNISFDPTGTKMAGVNSSGDAVLLDSTNGDCIHYFRMKHMSAHAHVCFSSDAKLAATDSKVIYVWNMQTHQLIHRITSIESVSSIYFAPDNTKIVIGDNTGAVSIYDLVTERISLVLSNNYKYITGACYLNDKIIAKGISHNSESVLTIWLGKHIIFTKSYPTANLDGVTMAVVKTNVLSKII